MPVTDDIKAAKERFSNYIDQLRRLLIEYNVSGHNWLTNLKSANEDPSFRSRRDGIWKELLEQEGAKLSLGMILGIIGAVMGGVGIAAGGSAIGLPLALLLVPTGLICGNELDAKGVTKKLMEGARYTISLFRKQRS